MDAQSEDVLRGIIRDYFKRLSILATQIPFEIRGLLLPPYMLYNGFKGYVHVDQTGRIGFEVYRERAGRVSVKTRNTKERVETEIFGILGKDNMFLLAGHDSELRGGVLTCKDFAERYGDQLPIGSAVLTFDRPGLIGPFEISEEAEFKIINVSIYWMIGKKRWAKHIPFAWVFGNSTDLGRIDPVLHAESDFHSTLFGRLYEIITRGYEEKVDKDTKSKVLEMYLRLIERVYEEFKNLLTTTKGDEQAFQQLLTRYKFFLSPGAKLIEGQPALNGKEVRRPDFRIQTSENETIYVEIEPPFFKPIEGSRPSRRLTGALKQVSQWKDILSHLGSQTENRYLIIIGLLNDLSKDEKQVLQTLSNIQEGLAIVAWDWILENIGKVRREMKEKLQAA